MKNNNVVEILYTDACPFWKETLNTISQVMKELNVTIPIKKTRIANEEEAKCLKFPGSPTVRLNGVDIDPAFKETTGYIGCRLYFYEGRTYEYPPKQMIKTAFQTMMKGERFKVP